jgi:hypothetical protein
VPHNIIRLLPFLEGYHQSLFVGTGVDSAPSAAAASAVAFLLSAIVSSPTSIDLENKLDKFKDIFMIYIINIM